MRSHVWSNGNKLDTTGLIDRKVVALYERRIHLCIPFYGAGNCRCWPLPEAYQNNPRVGLIAVPAAAPAFPGFRR